jgi:hypothetical protein
MNNRLLIAFLIPSLIILPYLLVDNAEAFKLTNYEIRLEVDFQNDEFTTNLPQLIVDLDSGVIEDDIFTIFDQVAVGQFTPDSIIADWNINIGSPNQGKNSHLVYNPVITEINTAQGVNKATIQDQIVNNMKSQVTSWLNNYGITSYSWKLFYDGGTQVIEERPPENNNNSNSDNVRILDTVHTTIANPFKVGTVIIHKDTNGGSDIEQFDFTSTFGDFEILVPFNSIATKTITGIDTRLTHSIQEIPRDGWTLESAVCDSGETIDSIDFDDSLEVTCTLVNTYGG